MDFYCLLTGLAAAASIFVMRITFQPPYFRELSVSKASNDVHPLLFADVSTSLSNCRLDWVEVPGFRIYRAAPNAGLFYLPDNAVLESRCPLKFISSPDRPTLPLRLILVPDDPAVERPTEIRIHWRWSFFSMTRKASIP